MAVKNVITAADLHPADFVVTENKVRALVERNEFHGEWSRGFTSGSGQANNLLHRKMVVQNGFGIIHLDFKRTSSTNDEERGGQIILRLPNTAPTPVALIETQLHDGGSVWIDPGSRTIKTNRGQATTNTRYIIDLIGFFNQ